MIKAWEKLPSRCAEVRPNTNHTMSASVVLSLACLDKVESNQYDNTRVDVNNIHMIIGPRFWPRHDFESSVFFEEFPRWGNGEKGQGTARFQTAILSSLPEARRTCAPGLGADVFHRAKAVITAIYEMTRRTSECVLGKLLFSSPQ